MGCRRLWALLSSLPTDAAIWEARGWTLQDELAARQVEATSGWLYAIASMFAKANFKKAPRLPKPEPIEHPARPKPVRPEPARARGVGDIQAFFAKHINR